MSDQKIAVDDDVSITKSESTEIAVANYTKLSYANVVKNSIGIAAEWLRTSTWRLKIT